MNRTWPSGIVDTHVHSAPDVIPRLMDDTAVAQAADEAGYRAVVLKSHHTLTSARATVAEAHTSEARVFGGVVLNLHATGGMNPYAVDAALKLGARIVWLPTFTSANQIRFGRRAGIRSGSLRALGTIDGEGIETVDDHGEVRPELTQILDMMAEAGATLATGHVSPSEIMTVVPEARRRGIKNVLITHPELECVGLPVADQVELAALGGVWFERVYGVTKPTSDNYPIADIAEAVRTVGVESTVMATDFGQVHNPSPVIGLREYIAEMREQGFTTDQIELMTCRNPAVAVGMSES